MWFGVILIQRALADALNTPLSGAQAKGKAQCQVDGAQHREAGIWTKRVNHIVVYYLQCTGNRVDIIVVSGKQ